MMLTLGRHVYRLLVFGRPSVESVQARAVCRPYCSCSQSDINAHDSFFVIKKQVAMKIKCMSDSQNEYYQPNVDDV